MVPVFIYWYEEFREVEYSVIGVTAYSGPVLYSPEIVDRVRMAILMLFV